MNLRNTPSAPKNAARTTANFLIFNFLLLLTLPFGEMSAQATFNTGLLEDDAAFLQNVEMTAEFSNDGRRALDLPRAVSLRAYTPIPQSQGDINSCIGWAMGYSALTTQRAYRENNTDRNDITKNSYSAMFIYNQVKAGNCLSGAYVHTAAKFLRENGDCTHREFDNPPSDCLREPAQELKQSSKQNSIKDYVALFSRDTDAKTKVMRTKRSIAEGKPVVLGIRIRESLKAVKKTDPIWKPSDRASDNILGGHAVAVVGYSDSSATFEVMNSWGQRYADDGFFYISYKDFTQYAFQGLQMILADEVLTEEQLAEIDAIRAEGDVRKTASGRNPNATKPGVKPAARTTIKPSVASTTNNSDNNSASNSGDQPTDNSPSNQSSGQTKPAVAAGGTKPVVSPTGGSKPSAAAKKIKTPNQQSGDPAASDAPTADNSTLPATNNPFSDDANAALSGQFVVSLLQTDEFGTPLMTDGVYQFEELQPAAGEGFYGLSKTDWQVGDMFQVTAKSLKKDTYIYMFSLDGRNKAEIHWPRNQRFDEHKKAGETGLGEGALVGHSGAEILIPGNDKVLARENLLPDALVMLNSSQRIDDFQQRVVRLRDKTKGDITNRVQEAFGDIILPADKVQFASDAIGATAPVLEGGYAIPIILKIENQ